MPMGRPDGHVEERGAEVDDTEDSGAMDLACKIPEKRERMCINYSLDVKCTKICSGSGPTPWLECQVDHSRMPPQEAVPWVFDAPKNSEGAKVINDVGHELCEQVCAATLWDIPAPAMCHATTPKLA